MPEVVRTAVLPAFQLTDAQRALWATDTADESAPLKFLQSTHFVLDSLDEAEGNGGDNDPSAGKASGSVAAYALSAVLEPAGNETE